MNEQTASYGPAGVLRFHINTNFHSKEDCTWRPNSAVISTQNITVKCSSRPSSPSWAGEQWVERCIDSSLRFKHMFNTCVILIIYLQCNLLSSKYFSGSIIAMVLAKENCILEWRDLLGPTSSHRARETHPDRFLSVLISSYAHIWISEYP